MKFEIKDGILTKCILDNETSVIIPDGVTEIGDYAFQSRKNLTYVYMPDSVVRIGRKAFSKCRKLERIRMSDNLKSIGSDSFSDCISLKSINIPDGVEIIEASAFSECLSLEEVSIPENVTEIKDRTFARCSSLNKLHFNKNLKIIGQLAFWHCNSLTIVDLPHGLETFSDAFLECTAIQKVYIPSSIKCISDSAFRGCESLASVFIEEGITSIGHKAFLGCNLTSVAIPESVQEIGYEAFAYNELLETVHLPDNLICIPENLFKKCISLSNVNIPGKTESIGKDAFARTSVKTVNIPASVKRIGNFLVDPSYLEFYDEFVPSNPFRGCSKLEEITVDPLNSTYYSEKNCIIERKTKDVVSGCNNSTIPDGVFSIGNSAFEGMADIKEISIPESVTEIGEKSFAGISASVIKLPDNLHSIGAGPVGRKGTLVIYEGNSVPGKNLQDLGRGVFIAAPYYEIKSSFETAIGYGIYSYRTGTISPNYKKSAGYIRYYKNDLMKHAVEYILPNGIDFLGFIISKSRDKQKAAELVYEHIEGKVSAEIMSKLIVLANQSSKTDPISTLEEGLDDL